jgi:hypothetical protein
MRHASSGASSSHATLEHFSMDTYPFAGQHSGEITSSVRDLLGAYVHPPGMPTDSRGRSEERSSLPFWGGQMRAIALTGKRGEQRMTL